MLKTDFIQSSVILYNLDPDHGCPRGDEECKINTTRMNCSLCPGPTVWRRQRQVTCTKHVDDGSNYNDYGRWRTVWKRPHDGELDIDPSLWFFECHFPGDPVMPGCLGLDAMWQLVGFFLAGVDTLENGARSESEK